MRHWRSVVHVAALALALAPALAAAQERPEEPGTEDESEMEAEERRVVTVHTTGAPAVHVLHQSAGYLGVGVDDVDASEAEELGLPEVRGARVTSVAEGSPAEDAGLQVDDVILGYNGEPVESVAELTRLVRETPAGRRVRLEVFRDGSSRQLTVEVGDRGRAFSVAFDQERWEEMARRMRERFSEERLEEMQERMERLHERLGDLPGRFDVPHFDGEIRRFHGSRARLGARLQPLGDQLAEYFGVDDGALVAAVEEDAPAAEAGLQAGDVIVRAGDRDVEDVGDVVRAVREAEGGPFPLRVVRRGEERTITVELPEREARETGMLEALRGRRAPMARSRSCPPPPPVRRGAAYPVASPPPAAPPSAATVPAPPAPIPDPAPPEVTAPDVTEPDAAGPDVAAPDVAPPAVGPREPGEPVLLEL